MIVIVFCTFVGLCPIVLIEIIHFFPFIFAYYIDGTLNYKDLVIVLIIFNVPKGIFIMHFLKKVWFTPDLYSFERVSWSIFMTLILITVLLIPYLFIIFFKESKESNESFLQNGCCGSSMKYYWNAVIFVYIVWCFMCLHDCCMWI